MAEPDETTKKERISQLMALDTGSTAEEIEQLLGKHKWNIETAANELFDPSAAAAAVVVVAAAALLAEGVVAAPAAGAEKTDEGNVRHHHFDLAEAASAEAAVENTGYCKPCWDQIQPLVHYKY